MRKINIAVSLVLIAGLLLPFSFVQAADNGVDDLRGRWDVVAFLFNPQDETEDPLPPVILYVNEMRASVVLADTFYAGGCMRSPETNAFMPLSIRAVYHAAANSYDVVIYSTYVPPEGEPFVMRLKGVVEVRGEGVKDDSGGGELVTEFATGEWSAIHHDRRVTKCPSVQDIGLGAQGDVYAHQDLGYASPKYYTLYETHTIIVSSGMLVETPDGSSTIVQEYTDLFSPDVDFVGRFRYLTHFEGQPVSGGIYKFTLLDVFGDPIPGTESTDIWTGCSQTAPMNLAATYDSTVSVMLDWDPAADVPGEFEPAGDPQIGYYQIGIYPFNWEGANDFGANNIQSSEHLIPWNPFEPGIVGSPDGYDFGVSLSELEDGAYLMDVSAFAWPNPQSGGIGHECAVYDSSERLVMVKQGGDLNLQDIATISGRTVDEDGEPIAGIEVNACEYDWHDGDFCGGDRTDENGDYTISVIPGSYRVSVYGQAGWANQFYENTADWGLATEVFANAGQDTPDVNFVLLHGGSISGFVFDADGIPQANIAVDTELGGYGTCTDENGYYILQGVPFGTYNIVAGRDFCGAHPFLEGTVADVTLDSLHPDVGGVDFYLTLAEPMTIYLPYGMSGAAYEDFLSAAENLSVMLQNYSGKTMNIVVPADDRLTGQSDSISAMETGEADIAFLSWFAYLLAHDRVGASEILVPVMNGQPYYESQILTHNESGVQAIQDLAGQPLCWADPTSASGYVIPSIMLMSNGLDPLANATFAGSHLNVAISLYNRECAGGGAYVDVRERLLDDYPDMMDVVLPVAISPPTPFDGFVFHPDLPGGLRSEFITTLREIAATPEGSELLAILLTPSSSFEFQEHNNGIYHGLQELLASAGLSASELWDMFYVP